MSEAIPTTPTESVPPNLNRLPDETVSQASADKKNKRRMTFIGIGVAVVVILIAGDAAAGHQHKTGDDQDHHDGYASHARLPFLSALPHVHLGRRLKRVRIRSELRLLQLVSRAWFAMRWRPIDQTQLPPMTAPAKELAEHCSTATDARRDDHEPPPRQVADEAGAATARMNRETSAISCVLRNSRSTLPTNNVDCWPPSRSSMV